MDCGSAVRDIRSLCKSYDRGTNWLLTTVANGFGVLRVERWTPKTAVSKSIMKTSEPAIEKQGLFLAKAVLQ
jgi:hypothetical protein